MQGMTRAWIATLAAGVIAVVAACSSGAGKSGGVPTSSSHTPAQATSEGSPSSAEVCGAWSAVNSPQALAVRALHGTLDSCQRVGVSWYVTAISDDRPGQIGYLVCAETDTTCLDGPTTHDLTRFTWISAPAAAGPGLKLYSAPSPNEWIFYTRKHGMVRFTLATKEFSLCPSGICR